MVRLDKVHPELVRRVQRVLTDMEGIGRPMVITNGIRTQEEQEKLYAQGRTAPGKIVTHCDGVKDKSNHQPKHDGYGYAVDVTFVDAKGQPRWVDSDPWDHYGAALKVEGLLWGGDWKHPDKPHAELPENWTKCSPPSIPLSTSKSSTTGGTIS